MAAPRNNRTESSTPIPSKPSSSSKSKTNNGSKDVTNSSANTETTESEQAADPLDFDTLSVQELRKYRQMNRINTPSALSGDGYILGGVVGKKTNSYKNRTRVPKHELATVVKKHFMAQNIRESETIVDFIYCVKNQDKAFKLQFSP